MYEISYDIDYTPLFDYIVIIEQVLQEASELKRSVQAAGDYFVQKWIDTAQTKFKHSQGGYARGIVEGVNYPYNNNELEYNITHTSKIAVYLEKGTEPYDLKKMLYTSAKVRVSKDGKRYLIIPFRHGVPGTKMFAAMPKDIYA